MPGQAPPYVEKYWGGKRVAGDFEGWHPVAEVCEIKMKKLKTVQHVFVTVCNRHSHAPSQQGVVCHSLGSNAQPLTCKARPLLATPKKS